MNEQRQLRVIQKTFFKFKTNGKKGVKVNKTRGYVKISKNTRGYFNPKEPILYVGYDKS